MSKVRMLHTADLHLGLRQYGLDIREQDFYSACMGLVDTAIEQRCTVIILAGDNFDAPRPQPAAVEALQTMVARAKENGIDVCGIDGNHDSSNSSWLRICGVTPLDGSQVVYNGVCVAGFDACRPVVFAEKMDALAKAGGADILVIHQAMAEMADYSKQDFSAEALSVPLAAMGVKYVAMGDIHATRETSFNGVWFAYPGSIEMNAADEQQQKSAIVIEWDTDTKTFVTQLTPLKTRKFATATITSMADIEKLSGLGADGDVGVVWWNKEGGVALRKAVEVASAPMLARCCTVRLIPYGEYDEPGSVKIFERKDAVARLKEAVVAYFEPETDEYQLVMQIMGVVGGSGSMIPVVEIVNGYMAKVREV